MPHINLSTPEVLALQAGATEFIRPIKPQPYYNDRGFLAWKCSGALANMGRTATEMLERHCPYGQPGDVLACRETWRRYNVHNECACYDNCTCASHHGQIVFRADIPDCFADEDSWKSPVLLPLKEVRYRVTIVSATPVETATGWVWKIKHGGIES